jgi:hypothetical protein
MNPPAPDNHPTRRNPAPGQRTETGPILVGIDWGPEARLVLTAAAEAVPRWLSMSFLATPARPKAKALRRPSNPSPTAGVQG